MQNWEVVKKKISEMAKDEFIEFISKVGAYDVQVIGDICNIERVCNEVDLCSTENWRCEDCLKKLLKSEYQPPKQEKWIVHRTLRTQNKETYIGNDNSNTYKVKLNIYDTYNTTYKKEKATRYKKEDAIIERDRLNDDRIGKQYLWVISKAEE